MDQCSDPDRSAFEAWHTMLRAHTRVMNVLERELHAATGLTMSAYEVLISLRGRPDGRCRMQDLSDAVLLSKSGTTRVVAQLADAGLVARHVPPDNRRTIHAVLTDEGEARIDAAAPVLQALVHEHFGRHLAGRDAPTLTRILGRIPG